MRTIFEKKQWILALLIFSLLFSIMIFEASAVDKNEVESNNTAANATVTYDDYNNYGKISTASDVDWWQITFTSSGNANFWLGSIPSGCVYYMELYEFDGSQKIAESKQELRTQQLIKARVYSGVTYKIKIYSKSGYSNSASYKFRIKNYTGTLSGNVYTTSYFSNYQQIASEIMAHTTSMGYNDNHYYNYSSTSVYNQLDDIDLAVIAANGSAGRVTLASSTYLVGNAVNNSLTGYKGIGDYADLALSDMRLICFQSAYSGSTSSSYGNLVNKAREMGALCCIGWETSIDQRDLKMWNEYFFDYLDSGCNVQEALNLTNYLLESDAYYPMNIRDYYSGTSQLSALALG